MSQSRNKKAKKVSPFLNYWTNRNWLFFSIATVILLLGFFLLSISPYDNVISLSVAPIVILIAYVVLFPIAILIKDKKTNQ